jgi:hypothetical protein
MIKLVFAVYDFLYPPKLTANQARERSKKLSVELNSRIQSGVYYVFNDKPITACHWGEPNIQFSGYVDTTLNLMTQNSGIENAVERSWSKKGDNSPELSELNRTLRKFEIQEVSEKVFKIAQWMNASPNALVKVDVTGRDMKCWDDGYEYNEIGVGFEYCTLKYIDNGDVVIDLTTWDEQRKIYCSKPKFTISPIEAKMTCSNLEGEFLFRYKWHTQPQIPSIQSAACITKCAKINNV